jgi:hypothetical protein
LRDRKYKRTLNTLVGIMLAHLQVVRGPENSPKIGLKPQCPWHTFVSRGVVAQTGGHL